MIRRLVLTFTFLSIQAHSAWPVTMPNVALLLTQLKSVGPRASDTLADYMNDVCSHFSKVPIQTLINGPLDNQKQKACLFPSVLSEYKKQTLLVKRLIKNEDVFVPPLWNELHFRSTYWAIGPYVEAENEPKVLEAVTKWVLWRRVLRLSTIEVNTWFQQSEERPGIVGPLTNEPLLVAYFSSPVYAVQLHTFVSNIRCHESDQHCPAMVGTLRKSIRDIIYEERGKITKLYSILTDETSSEAPSIFEKYRAVLKIDKIYKNISNLNLKNLVELILEKSQAPASLAFWQYNAEMEEKIFPPKGMMTDKVQVFLGVVTVNDVQEYLDEIINTPSESSPMFETKDTKQIRDLLQKEIKETVYRLDKFLEGNSL